MKQFNNTHINFIIETANSKENNFRKTQALEQMVYNLAGDSNKDKRQVIYSELTGKKQPKAESGVNNILAEIKKYIVLNDKDSAAEQPKVKAPESKKNTLDEVLNELITNRENTLSIKSKTITLTKDSLGNPRIQVGTIPYYDWQEDKRITYIICYGRYITCEMLVYEKLLNGYEYLKTQDQEEAKNYIKAILKDLTNPKQEVKAQQPKQVTQAQVKTVTQITAPAEKVQVEVVNYSEKAIAIFGDTKSIKDKLKDIGARYNPFLTHNGNKTAGWILPVTKQQLLNSII